MLLAERGWQPLTCVDVSETAVETTRQLIRDGSFCVVDDSGTLPFPAGSFDLIVAWGVLHYNSPSVRNHLMGEVVRTLGAGGLFLGTLRASGETHIQGNADLDGANFELYDRDQAQKFLAEFFPIVELGYSERAPLGDLERRICHWFFRCRNDFVA